MKTRYLSESLPIRYPNGQQVRYFAKHCPRCHCKIESEHMHGLARCVREQVILAAHATCPQCGHGFNICCAIDMERNVSRLWLPAAFLIWWLGTLPTPIREVITDTPPPSLPAAPPVVEAQGEPIGYFDSRPIPAWIQVAGRRYRFDHTHADASLAPSEIRIDGMIFTLED